MKNFQQEGKTITFTAGANLAAGAIVVIGHMIGVVVNDVASGAVGVAAVEGVFSGVPKVSGAVFVQGEKLIWDASVGAFDDSAATPASGDVTGGATAWVAGANGETTCTIKLTPGNTTLAA